MEGGGRYGMETAGRKAEAAGGKAEAADIGQPALRREASHQHAEPALHRDYGLLGSGRNRRPGQEPRGDSFQ
jgi:hypothetical protein